MKKELPKTYEPQSTEKRLYEFWEQSGFFNAEVDPDRKPFTIVIPPPNVTGQLHMGHALDETLQDVLIRYKRMQGYSALWLPGTDHAGIATQIKVEAELRKEGKTRFDLGREAFLDRVWEWKRLYGGRIIQQLKSLGSSCDWRRERFTMDEGCSRAVREVFVELYNKGLIYRGNRIINWCPRCTTALSDAEVEYEEQPGNFWHIRYPVKDSDEFVTIATTRPETLLGDTAVAVNPEDERYTHLVGKTLILPLVGREIPVIADEYVDREFGTGCVKITPCHDPNDFEVGRRHNLPEILILDGDAKIINGGKYDGMDRYEARKAIVADLEEGGYLVRIEPHVHNVGTCYRCHTTVEPIASKQWFVKMQPLCGPAIDAVKSGDIEFVPDRFAKNYIHWMENLRDWCISRQLWWGHRIPAFYCADCGEMTVSKDDVTVCPKCGSTHIEQDPDVLDTWFSSALWPFSTLGWPDRTPELDYFYPTSVLVTGYDIIPFWVSRMIFSGLEQMHEKPFDKVLIHGLVRDAQGRKMSKSLGNGIDPLEVVEKYGADALRFTLVTGNSPGNDMRFIYDRVESNRNFANKIWNAARFVLMNLTIDDDALPENLELEDRWILSKFNRTAKIVGDNLDSFELGVAAQNLYDFIWDDFCDWYIELVKTRLREGGAPSESAQRVLVWVLSRTLKLLHPFMPFLTDEIWQALPHAENVESIMISSWPAYDPALDFSDDERDMEKLMAAIRAVRNRRAEMNIAPSKLAHLTVQSHEPDLYRRGEAYIRRLAYASGLETITEAPADPSGFVVIVTDAATLYLPLAELVDLSAERARLEKELKKAEDLLASVERKLANPGFTAKAPENVIAMERDRAEKNRALVAKLRDSLARLGQ
ncbi:MAG: valine--tRNA ligase [Clostridiales bacterium]|nr:valine--tRNA ligase [Clostridiales bacterium]